MPSSGALICLVSAVAFGAMGICGKLAYGEGATVGTLLSLRFAVAAALFWIILAVAPGRDRACSRRDLCAGLALGAAVYSAQAGAYFAALTRLDASLLSLVLYTFPAMVAVAAIATGRERANPRTAAALALASAGLSSSCRRRAAARSTWWERPSASRRRPSTARTASSRAAWPPASIRSCWRRSFAPARSGA